jgi:FkbM family methyltransferase
VRWLAPLVKRGLQQAGWELRRQPRAAAALRVDGPFAQYPSATGPFWLPRSAPDDVVVAEIVHGHVFEEDVIRALRPFIERGSAVIDVGACFGQMSQLFAEAVGPDGEVHAFEANAFCAEIVRRNVNGRNIQVHECAAWEVSGARLSFPEPDFRRFGSWGSYSIDPSGGRGVPVRSLALDDLPTRRRVSAVKIDVQGSDLFVLRGARKLLARDRPAVVFEFEQQFQDEFKTSFQDYVDLVRELDYRFRDVILGINFLIVPA